MITADKIEPLRNQQIDFESTKQLKDKLAQLRQQRQPLYLTKTEFEEILKWKLDKQIGRQREMRAANTDEVIRAVTGLALTITLDDKEYELELRVKILCALRGVAIPIASAVLALVFPEEYAVIDYRGWRQVFEETKGDHSLSDYKKYLDTIRPLAKELGWSVQEVDHVIWEYDRRHSKQVTPAQNVSPRGNT
jgi:thermostable 8-oxoguanine DNA glycosylase